MWPWVQELEPRGDILDHCHGVDRKLSVDKSIGPGNDQEGEDRSCSARTAYKYLMREDGEAIEFNRKEKIRVLVVVVGVVVVAESAWLKKLRQRRVLRTAMGTAGAAESDHPYGSFVASAPRHATCANATIRRSEGMRYAFTVRLVLRVQRSCL